MNILRRSFLNKLSSLGVSKNYPVRTIFTEETLGITTYLHDRKIEEGRSPTKFLQILQDETSNQDWGLRYPLESLVDDLRLFVYVVQPDQIELLRKSLMLYRIQSLSWMKKDGPKKSYVFGSIVMRFLSHFKMPATALQFFSDKAIGPLFEDLTSYVILLDMMYDGGLYDEVINIHKLSENRIVPQKGSSTFIPINAIVFAACLQLNTPEYRQYAYDLYERIKNENMIKAQLRKGVAQVAEMKRRDNQPEECLSILSEIESADPSARYIKILALLDLNRLEEALQLLSVFVRIQEFSKVFPVPNELLELMSSKIIADNKKFSEDIEFISKRLKKMKRTTDKSLNDAICHPYPKKLVLFRKPHRFTKMYKLQN